MVSIEIVVLLLLIGLNGLLAMSEMALVAARRASLQQRVDKGDEGARVALALAQSPTRFLSTVQIGITLVGILAGAFGGATMAESLAAALVQFDWLAPYAQTVSVGIVVLIITYLSLVFGELAPKRIALQNAEGIAIRVARPMRRLSQLVGPIVSLLTLSTNGVLKLLRIQGAPQPTLTEEEIRVVIAEGTALGVVEPIEEAIVEQVFRLGNRSVSAVITPRTEVVWLDLADSDETLLHKIRHGARSRYPVAKDNLDHVVGIVLAKDLLAQSLAGESIDLEAAMQPPLFVPDSVPALEVVERFKATHNKIALVIDEYGGLEGLVTIDDLMEAMVGEIQEFDEEPQAVQRDDGSWLLDGRLPVDEFRDMFEILQMPGEDEARYETVGGFMMTALNRVPKTGDHFTWHNLHLEVMDMDGRRVDQVLVTVEEAEE